MQDSVTAFAALGLAFYYSWSLTLVTLSTVPILAVVLAWNSSRMQPSIEMQAEKLTAASRMANDAISAIDTVKCFNGQGSEIWQYRMAIARAARHYLRLAHANALQIGGLRLVTLGMFVQGFWFGSHLVGTGKKNPGDILTAFWSCLMATQAFERIHPDIVYLEKGKAAGATLESTLDQIVDGLEISVGSGRSAPLCCAGGIEVRDVCEKVSSTQDLLNKTGLIFLPFPTQSARFEKRQLLLPSRRDDICSWKERLWQKYTGKPSDAILQR